MIWGKVQKNMQRKTLLENQKVRTNWKQGLQWYSIRYSPKRKVIEMIHVAAKFMHKWLVMDLFGKGPKEICIEKL